MNSIKCLKLICHPHYSTKTESSRLHGYIRKSGVLLFYQLHGYATLLLRLLPGALCTVAKWRHSRVVCRHQSHYSSESSLGITWPHFRSLTSSTDVCWRGCPSNKMATLAAVLCLVTVSLPAGKPVWLSDSPAWTWVRSTHRLGSKKSWLGWVGCVNFILLCFTA